MEQFEFLRNVTVGQYIQGDSIFYNFDPRVKLVCSLLLIIVIAFSPSYLGNAILLVVTIFLILISEIPIKYALQGIRPAIPVIIIFAIMQLLFLSEFYIPPGGLITLFEWGPIHITNGSVQMVTVGICRLIELLLLVSLLTSTTTTSELTHGIESLMSPVAKIGFPAHEFALIFTIAFRFVPILALELERIFKAQVSRGANLGQRSRLRFIQQTKYLLPVFIPLFMDALRRAEDIIIAMEARCYLGGKGRTHLIQFHASFYDFIFLFLTVIFTVFMFMYKFPF